LALASCSSDDSPSASRLIGTWKLVYYEEWGTINGQLDYEEQEDYTSGNKSSYITFNEDGTLFATSIISSNEDGTLIGTSIHNGRKSENNGTWEIKGNKFYWSYYGNFDYNDIDDTYKISTLTKTTLIIEWGPYTDYDDGDKYVDYEKYTFERVGEEE